MCTAHPTVFSQFAWLSGWCGGWLVFGFDYFQDYEGPCENDSAEESAGVREVCSGSKFEDPGG